MSEKELLKQWEGKEDYNFWCVEITDGAPRVEKYRWQGDETNKEQLLAGNVFETREGAEEMLKRVGAVLKP